jgi:ABC-type transport system involved in multi-copper enzyme maturation permease subunit
MGPNGTAPLGYQLYYRFYNATQNCQTNGNGQECTSSFNLSSNLNQSDSQYLGTMSSYRQIFHAPPEAANLSGASYLLLGLFYPNGTSASPQPSVLPFFELYPSTQNITPLQGSQLVAQFFESIFGLFIPLMAIVGTYNLYGKDRVSGVLESVLAQPVSRKGLSISRFVSTFVAMAAAICISVTIIDIITLYFTKAFVSSTIILSSTGAFLVELATFIGIMMLLSHVLRSSGALIGIGIGIFMVIDFFWGVIISLMAAIAHIDYGSSHFFQIAVAAEFANPAQFVGLVDTYLTHLTGFVGISAVSGFPITPEAYWISIPSIIATGIFWIVVPLAAFLYLAIKRD